MIGLIDTGPLVAALSRRDTHHAWARERFAAYTAPLLTTESVISEAAFLIRRTGQDPAAVVALVARGVLRVEPVLDASAARVLARMQRYASVPMALADAALVELAERWRTAPLLTPTRTFSSTVGATAACSTWTRLRADAHRSAVREVPSEAGPPGPASPVESPEAGSAQRAERRGEAAQARGVAAVDACRDLLQPVRHRGAVG